MSEATESLLTPEGKALRVRHEQREQLKGLMEGPVLPDAVARKIEANLERRAARKMQESIFGASVILPSVSIDTLQRFSHQPSPAQSAYLAAALAQKKASIANLDGRELDLQLKMNNLMKEMRTLRDFRSREQEEADSFASLLAPVRLLSPELLARVFQYAIPAQTHPRRVLSPLGLSHVCSAWRKTIMRSSAFWNKLSIQVDAHAKSNHDPDIIASWYGRANSKALLSLSLSTTTYVRYLPKSMYSSMVNFSHRLTELRIYGDYGFLSEFLQLPGKTLPVLETLSLVGLVADDDGDYDDDDDDDEPEYEQPLRSKIFKPSKIEPSEITVFDGSPPLRFVTLGLPSNAFRKKAFFALPWSSITHIEIQGEIIPGALTRLTNRCPKLQAASFVVDLEGYSDDGIRAFNPSGMAALVDLVSLRLQLCLPNQAYNALPIKPLPKLTTLELVDDEDHRFSFPLCAIFPGILDSLASVRCLQLSHISCSYDELLQLVTACPMLEDLRMHVLDVPPTSQLQCLRQDPPDRDGHAPPLLAHLASFTFVFASYDEHDSVEAVGAAFSKLVYTWAEDPRRRRPLENLSLYVWNQQYWLDEDNVAARRALECMQDEICAVVEQAQSSRPVVDVDILNSFREVASRTGTFWRTF